MKLESTLSQHYQLMKAKLINVQQKVESTDASIERLSRLLDAVTENVLALPDPVVPIFATQNSVQPRALSQPTQRPVMTWKRKKTQAARRTFQSQSEIDSSYF